MRFVPAIFALALALAAAPARAGDPFEVYSDPQGDALPRRTDPGADGPMNPDQVLPDLLSLTLSKWQPTSPNPVGSSDPFVGAVPNSNTVHLFRLDLVFAGLVNPPGPLALSAAGAQPFIYGPSPLYGFVELNIDRERDTGGDLTSEAENHFLANIGRFGCLPSSSIAERAVTRPGQTLNHSWTDNPQFERSGAEFILKLCGCEPLTIVATSVPGDAQFTEGDTWIVRGRFFERTSGYQPISRMNLTGAACGQPGRYDPLVNLRFQHDIATDHTTVSLVYALDQIGAAALAGLSSTPPVNSQVECDGNSGSILEALTDVAEGAEQASRFGWPGNFTRTLAQEWVGVDHDDIEEMLDPTRWRVSALFGTSYSTSIFLPPSEGSLYIWTDVGFGCRTGDYNDDALSDSLDRDAVASRIQQADGTADDADGTVNGQVVIPGFGPWFDAFDVNGDGLINADDLSFFTTFTTCPADWNHQNGLTLQDLFDFLGDWFSGVADYNADGSTTIQDIFDYLTGFFSGCP